MNLLTQVAERAAEIRDRLLGQTRLEDLRISASKVDRALHGHAYFRVTAEAAEAWGESEKNERWGDWLLCDLIARVEERLADAPTPESIVPQMAHEFSRILNDAEKGLPGRDLAHDRYLKDLSLCRLASVPCVAQIVDKYSGIPRRVIAKNFFREPGASLALGMRSGFRYAPALELHTHTPMMKQFTPQGWDACYLLVADLLELYPESQGLTGSAWFYDPAVDRVSPWLSYLRERPLSGGAILLEIGQKPTDVANATAFSEERLKAYRSGAYRPCEWMMIWPRQALIDWARAHRRSI